jgi:hypothetical protein
MNRKPLLVLLTGCSDPDQVVHVSSDDPEMIAAIGKARECHGLAL